MNIDDKDAVAIISMLASYKTGSLEEIIKHLKTKTELTNIISVDYLAKKDSELKKVIDGDK